MVRCSPRLPGLAIGPETGCTIGQPGPGYDPRRPTWGRSVSQLGPLPSDLAMLVGTAGVGCANCGIDVGMPALLTGTSGSSKLPHVRQACGGRTGRPHERRSGGPQGRAMLSPAARGPSLWPSTPKRPCWACALAAKAHRATTGRSPRVHGRAAWVRVRNAGEVVGVVRYADGRGAPFPGVLRDSPSARGSGFPAEQAQAAAPGRHPPALGPQRDGVWSKRHARPAAPASLRRERWPSGGTPRTSCNG
jgi:hypothetical protein